MRVPCLHHASGPDLLPVPCCHPLPYLLAFKQSCPPTHHDHSGSLWRRDAGSFEAHHASWPSIEKGISQLLLHYTPQQSKQMKGPASAGLANAGRNLASISAPAVSPSLAAVHPRGRRCQWCCQLQLQYNKITCSHKAVQASMLSLTLPFNFRTPKMT